MSPAPAAAEQLAASTGRRSSLRADRLRQVLLAVGLSLVLAAGVATVGGIVLITRFDGAIGKANLLAPNARAEPAQRAAVTGPLNFLFIGSDLRVRNPNAGQRSDTIIIAHVTQALDRVFLVSIPRDLLVAIPPDPAVGFPGDTTKINAAFEFGKGGAGGTRLLSQTLTNLAGIRFDGAAVVEFSGLKRAVDVIGGVTMCIDVRTVSIHTGKVFEPGCRLLGSTDALDYLRQRHFDDGDFTRQRHQQQFLKAFLAKALSAGVVANPLKLDELLRAVGSALTVDTGVHSLTDLVYALRDIQPNRLTGIKIPTYYDTWDGQSVVVATAEATGLFKALQTDTLGAWTVAHKQWVNSI